MTNTTIYPIVGEFYRHFKGDLYKVIALAQDADAQFEATYVVYEEVGYAQTYIRRIESWLNPVGPDALVRFKHEPQ